MPSSRSSFPPLHLPLYAFLALSLAACTRSSPAPKPALPSTSGEGGLAIVNVRVFDGEKVLPQRGVLVHHDRIVALLDGEAPPGVASLDGRGGTLMPGLIDAHVHVFGREQLERSLSFGVTTLLDMFSSPELVRKLRAEERAGAARDRADLRSAGTLVTAPGGHGTQYGMEIPTLARPEEADAFVKARLQEGSDFIKIVYGDTAGKLPNLSLATLKAVIAAAHQHKTLAVVHVNTAKDAWEALEAGADGLVHTYGRASTVGDIAKLAKSSGSFVTATLAVQGSASGVRHGEALLSDKHLSPRIDATAASALRARFPKVSDTWEVASSSVRELHAAGVDILAGTDAPNPGTTHGASLHHELQLLVEAGLSPVEALRAATALPASRFSLGDRGRIAPGMRADLVLVTGDPTTDILATRDIQHVIKEGHFVDLAARKAEAARSRQEMAGGLISDFEQPEVHAAFGAGWEVVTDALFRGSSKAELSLVDGGAKGTPRTLNIQGEVLPAPSGHPFAGAMFWPGSEPQEPANFGKGKSIRFSVRGDGRKYALHVYSARRGPRPAVKHEFVASEGWSEQVVSLDADGADATDVSGIWFGSKQPGRFQLQLDEIRIE